MIGRWFNQWVEDRLAVAITLAADMRQAVDLTYAPLIARGLTPTEAATIGGHGVAGSSSRSCPALRARACTL